MNAVISKLESPHVVQYVILDRLIGQRFDICFGIFCPKSRFHTFTEEDAFIHSISAR